MGAREVMQDASGRGGRHRRVTGGGRGRRDHGNGNTSILERGGERRGEAVSLRSQCRPGGA
eukprot:9341331-Prorocentrum_lima.AAC.1